MSDAPLSELPLSALLGRVATRTPAPGGGSAAATGCALAAALVEMAARFGTDPAAADDAQRAAQLRAVALELVERDARAFAPVLEAAALAPGAERTRRLTGARSRAAEPPLEIALAGAEVARLGVARVRAGNPNLTGDALTGVLLAEACTRAAAQLVAINLDAAPDPRRARAQAAAGDAAHARERALAAVDRAGDEV